MGSLGYPLNILFQLSAFCSQSLQDSDGKYVHNRPTHELTFCALVRLLRQTLMQPLNDIPTITTRLDALEELLSKEQVFFDLVVLLPNFPDLDHLHSQLVQVPNKKSQGSGAHLCRWHCESYADCCADTAEMTVLNILLLKRTLLALPQLAQALSSCENALLQVVSFLLSSSSLTQLFVVDSSKLGKRQLASAEGCD